LIKTEVIFWDWNGTLLDDVTISIDSMNAMLTRRSMKTIDYRYYTEIFGFPVSAYYKQLGFDFSVESFENLSVEFISEYNTRAHEAKLHQSVYTVLDYFKKLNKIQVIVSAMEQTMLEELLRKHKLTAYFKEVLGLKDIFASSKVHLAQDFIKRNNIHPADIMLIGDTAHDAEVAKEIGAKLILVSHGHNNRSRLSRKGTKVVSNLVEILSIID
jgi:phosphoglycolate phosphatase